MSLIYVYVTDYESVIRDNTGIVYKHKLYITPTNIVDDTQ